MDIVPGPECRIMAAIGLSPGSADMLIVQSGAGGPEELDHLWRRPPLALSHSRGTDRRAALDELRGLLEGFVRAARDYGVETAYLLIDGLDAWREDVLSLAAELGLKAFAPDARRRSDMALAAAARAAGGDKESLLLVLPEGAQTCVAPGDGRFMHVLPLGMDGGCIDELLPLALRDEYRRLGRKGGVDVRELLREAAEASARRIAPEGRERYRLCLALDMPRGLIEPGVYNARRFDKLTQNVARRAADAGALPCYALAEDTRSESYLACCLRRAHNALCLAGAVRAQLGKEEVCIVDASPLGELMHSLTGGQARPEEAGCDAAMARGGAYSYADAHGARAAQYARVTDAARALLDALSPAFDAGELDKASELTVLAAALCDSEADDAELSRAVERLPGLDERLRGMLTGICRALRSADNAAICASLMPESDAPGRDEEMFLPEPDAGEELAAADEFAPSDEYEYEPAEQEWEEPGAVGPYEGAPEPAPEADEGPAQYVRARLEQGGRAGVPLEMRVAAILALARALGSERLQDVSVRLSGRGMIVRAVPRERALLETLEFKYHAELFERAFGIRARLKLVKRRPGAGNR